jgi:hypothetical protein
LSDVMWALLFLSMINEFENIFKILSQRQN